MQRARIIAESLIQPQPTEQGIENCFLNPGSHAFLPTTAAALRELRDPNSGKMLAEGDGGFKIPSLRNIELTGLYLHIGCMAALEQVVEFYARGGNFDSPAKPITRLHTLPEL